MTRRTSQAAFLSGPVESKKLHLHQVKFGSVALLWELDVGVMINTTLNFVTSQDPFFIVFKQANKKKKVSGQSQSVRKQGHPAQNLSKLK